MCLECWCRSGPSHPLYKAYKQVISIFDLVQIIDQPTMITETSRTVLDHIITNRKENISQYGVIPVGLSDHMLIYCTRRMSRGHFKNRHSTKIRSLKNYSPEKCHNHLCEADWKPCFSSTCVDSSWKSFQSIFLSVLNEIAPIKEIGLKQRTEPWMKSNILDMIKERDSYLYKFRKSGFNDDYKYFSILRHKVQRSIKNANTEYFSDKIEEDKENPKKNFGNILKILVLKGNKLREIYVWI